MEGGGLISEKGLAIRIKKCLYKQNKKSGLQQKCCNTGHFSDIIIYFRT